MNPAVAQAGRGGYPGTEKHREIDNAATSSRTVAAPHAPFPAPATNGVATNAKTEQASLRDTQPLPFSTASASSSGQGDSKLQKPAQTSHGAERVSGVSNDTPVGMPSRAADTPHGPPEDESSDRQDSQPVAKGFFSRVSDWTKNRFSGPAPVQADLGLPNKFRYNEETKRWELPDD